MGEVVNWVSPRVNGSMLPSCTGKNVTLVGKVLSLQGNVVQVQAADGNAVTVQLMQTNERLSIQQVYEFNGIVREDCTLEAQDMLEYSDGFDLPTFNKMITYSRDPRFTHLFV